MPAAGAVINVVVGFIAKLLRLLWIDSPDTRPGRTFSSRFITSHIVLLPSRSSKLPTLYSPLQAAVFPRYVLCTSGMVSNSWPVPR